MVPTITTAVAEDAAEISALWNTKRGLATSCWQSAPPCDAAMAGRVMAWFGAMPLVARREGVLVGIGLAFRHKLISLGSADAETHYALLREWCIRNLAQNATLGICEVPATPTDESAWVDAIGPAITQTVRVDDTGQPSSVLLTCDFSALKARLDEML